MARSALRKQLEQALQARYVIERELGRGGMATVYLARDLKHDRQVAIKVLTPGVAASLGAERFLREITIVARLVHPHVVSLIDSGDAGGLLYYVAPYITGGSLRDRLDRDGKLPVRDVRRFVREIGSGLDYVHRSGFVHRDIKPANVLFVDGHAVLGDFGVANVGCEDAAEPLTDSGVAVGTPAYMSPEQASGETDLDRRSDIYSLACVVYEMLAGEPPFRASGARALMAKHVTETPRPIRVLRPEVGAGMEAALARALAKDPAHRFASVADFVVAFGESQPSGGGSVSGARSRSIAVLPFVNASRNPDNEYLSDGITDELIDALAKVEGLHVVSRTSVFALKGKLPDVRAAGAVLGVAVVLEGTVRKEGNRLRITVQLTDTGDGQVLWSHRYDRTLADVFAMQDEIAQTIVTRVRATSLGELAGAAVGRHTANVKAYGLYLRGRYAWNSRTPTGVTDGIKYFEQAIAEDPRYAAAYTGLADSYALHVDYRDVPVDEGFARARAYAEQAIALDDRLADAHASLAWTKFIYDWDWAGADVEFRRAIELDPDYAPAHQWFAFLLVSQGRFDDALVESHTALELDSGSVSARRSLGWMYYYSRRYERAVYHLERTIALNPTADETYRILGLALAQQGDYAASEQVLREGADVPVHGTYTDAALGYVLARAGRRDEATRMLRELEARSRRGYVSAVARATLHLGLGMLDEAIADTEQAYTERRGWLVYLRVNPMLDPMRGDPRFESIAGRMKL